MEYYNKIGNLMFYRDEGAHFEAGDEKGNGAVPSGKKTNLADFVEFVLTKTPVEILRADPVKTSEGYDKASSNNQPSSQENETSKTPSPVLEKMAEHEREVLQYIRAREEDFLQQWHLRKAENSYFLAISDILFFHFSMSIYDFKRLEKPLTLNETIEDSLKLIHGFYDEEYRADRDNAEKEGTLCKSTILGITYWVLRKPIARQYPDQPHNLIRNEWPMTLLADSISYLGNAKIAKLNLASTDEDNNGTKEEALEAISKILLDYGNPGLSITSVLGFNCIGTQTAPSIGLEVYKNKYFQPFLLHFLSAEIYLRQGAYNRCGQEYRACMFYIFYLVHIRSSSDRHNLMSLDPKALANLLTLSINAYNKSYNYSHAFFRKQLITLLSSEDHWDDIKRSYTINVSQLVMSSETRELIIIFNFILYHTKPLSAEERFHDADDFRVRELDPHIFESYKARKALDTTPWKLDIDWRYGLTPSNPPDNCLTRIIENRLQAKRNRMTFPLLGYFLTESRRAFSSTTPSKTSTKLPFTHLQRLDEEVKKNLPEKNCQIDDYLKRTWKFNDLIPSCCCECTNYDGKYASVTLKESTRKTGKHDCFNKCKNYKPNAEDTCDSKKEFLPCHTNKSGIDCATASYDNKKIIYQFDQNDAKERPFEKLIARFPGARGCELKADLAIIYSLPCKEVDQLEKLRLTTSKEPPTRELLQAIEDHVPTKYWLKRFLLPLMDTIYCYQEAIQLIQTFGVSYVLPYSIRGEIYFRLGESLLLMRQWFDAVRSIEERELQLEYLQTTHYAIIQYYSEEKYYEIDTVATIHKAYDDLQKVKEVHMMGSGYYQFLQKMYYLDDDYKDETSHLFCALERCLFRSGKVHDLIEQTEAYIRHIKDPDFRPKAVFFPNHEEIKDSHRYP